MNQIQYYHRHKLQIKNSSKICWNFLFLLFIFLPFIVFAESNFSFSTEPQNIPVSEISGPITIHSENPATETTYITLTSTSNTGQFFSSKTAIEPIVAGGFVYISTNNSNRTIYYKDSTAGNFVITANIFSKDKTTQLATITQNIFVGSSVQNQDTNQNVSDTNTNTNEQEQNTIQSSSNTSAHSSPAPLSNTENKIEFEISAGRDRLTSVGNKNIFIAKAIRVQNMSEKNIVYEWSFGDGTSARGEMVNHVYRFAGEYSVVVNGYYSDKQAVSRLKVLVVDPKLLITRVEGGIEILNSSGTEINLEGWNLIGQTKTFVFPQDTLLANNKKIVFADVITGINNGSIRLENPLGKKYAETSDLKGVVLGLSVNTEEISKEIEKAKETLEKINLEINPKIVSFDPSIKDNKIKPLEIIESEILKTEDNILNSNIIFEAPKQKSLVNTILSWPVKGFDYIRGLFVDE